MLQPGPSGYAKALKDHPVTSTLPLGIPLGMLTETETHYRPPNQVNPPFGDADRNRNARGRKRGQGDPPLFKAPLERTSNVTTSDTQDGDTPCPDCGAGEALQDVGGLKVTDWVLCPPVAGAGHRRQRLERPEEGGSSWPSGSFKSEAPWIAESPASSGRKLRPPAAGWAPDMVRLSLSNVQKTDAPARASPASKLGPTCP